MGICHAVSVRFSRDEGMNAIHTLNLAAGSHTKDSVISEISVKEPRIIVSKDSDFVYFYCHLYVSLISEVSDSSGCITLSWCRALIVWYMVVTFARKSPT